MQDIQIDLTDFTTKELSEELEQREGILKMNLGAHEEMKIITGPHEKTIQGPAIILINQD